MPGIRIGPNSIVGSHVCLTKDLEPGKSALSEPEHTIITDVAKIKGEEKLKTAKRIEGLQCAE